MIEALVLMMNSNPNVFGPLNLGNPKEICILDLAKLIVAKINSKSKIVFNEAAIDDPYKRKPSIKMAKKLLNWVRRETRKGLSVGGLCTAAYTMAKAGLLNGRRATIHWENQDSFTEDFDEVELTKSVFIKDGKFMTTAGGTSSIDLMLKLIAEDFGEDLANAVADQLIYSSIRTDQDTQRLSRIYWTCSRPDSNVFWNKP